ncbi:histidine phosphatase family protein [Congzhengia minquanensis]|uniref:Histidine phosphatase family protein n=1 Tax=Congzhengia minquanensis TaxID=2763657 RepID=A0A926DMS6_9FIRM|nr:histidine phosphatase family protein [Congzhengia minquanensis]MBC8540089.1 histidine phosphatase family protein [Congzhengia minquanensis]
MKIYIARHGLTDWNKEMRAQGRKDLPLNAEGRAQAEELRNTIKDIEFTAVYASPLKRAAETAQIAVGDRYDIIYDDRLLERSFGDFEGKVVKSWSELVDGVNIDDIALEEIPGGVEPVCSMLARVNSFLDYLKENYDDNATILVVGHGAMSKAFDWALTEHSADDVFGKTHLGNAEAKKYEAKGRFSTIRK